MKKRVSYSLALLLLPLAFIPLKASAVGCTVSAGTPTRVTLPVFAIDPNLPVGSMLAAKTISTAGIIGVCTGSTRYSSMMMGAWSTESSVMPGVYETGLPGVGVKISDYVVEGKNVPSVAQLSPNMTMPLTGLDIKLTFYRTGEITPGNFPAGQVASFSLPNTTGSIVKVMTLQVVSGGVRIKSCYAKNTNIIVPLGRHKRTEFSGPGSTSAAQPFNVDLVCQGDALPIMVSFDPAAGTTSPQEGVVPLLAEDLSAKGVAVKVMNNDGTPMQFGAVKTYHTNSEKSVTIPLLASYIQMDKTITPGSANAAMTFTITQN